jgi:peptide/nickel transport system permease protein
VGRFLVRRLLFTVFVLFVVSLITFVIFVKLQASDPGRRATGNATTGAIFNLPGIGQYGVTSIFRNDFPSVMGVTIFGGFFIAIANLCVDIAYAHVDLRVRFA